MPEIIEVAASCSALSSAIVKVVHDAEGIARKIRESRHDMVAMNAELLAIKISLDITHDDFSTSKIRIPQFILHATSGFLDVCGIIMEDLQKVMVKLSAVRSYDSGANGSKAAGLAGTRKRLQNLSAVLNIGVDHFHNLTLLASKAKCDTKLVAKTVIDMLERIRAQAARIKTHHGREGSMLRQCLEELRGSAEAFYEEIIAEQDAPARADSVEPEKGDALHNGSRSSSPGSSKSSGTEINVWLQNVASQIIQKPTFCPELITLPGPSQQQRKPSHATEASTFYSESTTSGSHSTATNKSQRSRLRNGRPQPIAKPKKKNRAPSIPNERSPSSIPLSRHTNADKIAIARYRRLDLSTDQRIAYDWDLRNLGPTTTLETAERVLFEGADPNMDDPVFGFLFVRAAYELPTSTMRLLVEYGADVTQTRPNNRYFSAIHAAVLGKNLDNVQYLVELGIPVDITNTDGETPLHCACRTPGAYSIVRYLLEAGADVSARTITEGTHLQAALQAPRLESRERSMIVELLLAHGAENDITVESCGRRGKGLSVLGLI